MTLTKTLAAAAAATFIASSAFAGGFGSVITEPDPIEVMPVDEGSLPGWVIPAVIVAALIAVASSGDDDDGDTAGGGGAGTNF